MGQKLMNGDIISTEIFPKEQGAKPHIGLLSLGALHREAKAPGHVALTFRRARSYGKQR